MTSTILRVFAMRPGLLLWIFVEVTQVTQMTHGRGLCAQWWAAFWCAFDQVGDAGSKVARAAYGAEM
jgi:hypothetical protein